MTIEQFLGLVYFLEHDWDKSTNVLFPVTDSCKGSRKKSDNEVKQSWKRIQKYRKRLVKYLEEKDFQAINNTKQSDVLKILIDQNLDLSKYTNDDDNKFEQRFVMMVKQYPDLKARRKNIRDGNSGEGVPYSQLLLHLFIALSPEVISDVILQGNPAWKNTSKEVQKAQLAIQTFKRRTEGKTDDLTTINKMTDTRKKEAAKERRAIFQSAADRRNHQDAEFFDSLSVVLRFIGTFRFCYLHNQDQEDPASYIRYRNFEVLRKLSPKFFEKPFVPESKVFSSLTKELFGDYYVFDYVAEQSSNVYFEIALNQFVQDYIANKDVISNNGRIDLSVVQSFDTAINAVSVEKDFLQEMRMDLPDKDFTVDVQDIWALVQSQFYKMPMYRIAPNLIPDLVASLGKGAINALHLPITKTTNSGYNNPDLD